MSESHGTKAVIAAFLANTGIGITKLIAWLLSGSASMLAEAIHSFADSMNQLLLLLGGRLAKRKADTDHPFGYGRERYVWAFIVALILFSVGGVFSIVEGIDKLQHPHELENVWIPLGVLAVAIVLESFSLRTAVIESRKVKGSAGWWRFIRTSRSPELPVILLEDVAALTGLVLAFSAVGLTAITGDATFDALGTLAIGVLLVIVAIILAIEMKSLLIGEGATADDHRRILEAINGSDEVEAVIHMKTLYLGPDELMVAAKVAFPPTSTLEDVARAIDALERHVREAVPVARVIYIEPDIYLAKPDIAPSTDHIVIQSGN
ncbi:MULTISPECIES: cation diffusion facilitator family transporter [unclassified Agrococcus]|uniref:cation diffusion facilitator family transporter n=1 Tax=unclassified Agrococcus TaxID=2615065 RepID=UPI0036097C1F